ncbi:MAG TPA: sulfatase-like hydrolase/transferase [Allosphingosinicella sp.]|jgi:hypothetical protein
MSSRFVRYLPWGIPALAFGGTAAFELALVERKYAIFGGGFGAGHVLDTAKEVALFAATLAAAQAVLIGGLWLLIRSAHRKRPESPTFLLNFLFFAPGGLAALLLAKFEALSYFSDALGFELIKNLGGGSVAGALVYVALEAAIGLAVCAGAVAVWWIGLRLARRRLPERVALPGLQWRHVLWAALPLPLLAAAAAREPDVRFALARTTAPAGALALLHQTTDFDRDGYSGFSAQRDGFPFDSARHPLAFDIPGNGVDEDGFGGDFRFEGPLEQSSDWRPPGQPKHVVLIVLESVRGDAVGKQVAGRPVTPQLNALARSGTWVREAYSHVGFTTASGKSIFSGALEPGERAPSLFRDLKGAGYRVGVFSAAPENFGGISAAVGMRENADLYVDAELLKAERAHSSAALGSLALDGRKVLREFDRHFRSAGDWKAPTFLYFNFQEAHFPYRHRDMPRLLPGDPVERGEIQAENRERVEATYWNAVAYSDWLVGQVVARLKRMGVWERSLLVVTGDHGEALFEDGFIGHGHILNRAQTHVPLIFSVPGAAAANGPVGLADYRGLILRALSGEPPAQSSGTVFQFIGTLHRPDVIGMVEAGGKRTTLNLETAEVEFSDLARNIRYTDLRPGTELRVRADRLANEWARQRWLARRASS